MAQMRSKSVGFNVEDPKEKFLYEYCNKNIKNFSEYVRDLVMKDISKTDTEKNHQHEVTRTDDGGIKIIIK